MRIISGQWKGRTVEPPADCGIRPTTDRAREALFNILDHRLVYQWTDIEVLDLFGGSGAVSLEFLSRGVKSVTTIEKNPKIIRYLKELQQKWNADHWHIHQADVLAFLQNESQVYDVIFADPPYNLYNKSEIVSLAFTRELVHPEGWFILEHAQAERFDALPHFFDLRIYSASAFSFFRNLDDALPDQLPADAPADPHLPQD